MTNQIDTNPESKVVIDLNTGEEQSLKEISGVVEKAQATVVKTKEEFDYAIDNIDVLKDKMKKVKEFFEPTKSAAWKTHQLIATKEKEVLSKLRTAVDILDAKVTTWRNEQIEKERIERVKREAEARRIQEEQAQREAEELAEAGMIEEAEEVIEQVIENPAPAPVPPPTMTSHTKANFQTRYRAEVFSMKLLVKAVYEGKVSVEALKVNQVFLDGQARLYKEKLTHHFPGVKPIAKTSSVQKRR